MIEVEDTLDSINQVNWLTRYSERLFDLISMEKDFSQEEMSQVKNWDLVRYGGTLWRVVIWENGEKFLYFFFEKKKESYFAVASLNRIHFMKHVIMESKTSFQWLCFPNNLQLFIPSMATLNIILSRYPELFASKNAFYLSSDIDEEGKITAWNTSIGDWGTIDGNKTEGIEIIKPTSHVSILSEPVACTLIVPILSKYPF